MNKAIREADGGYTTTYFPRYEVKVFSINERMAFMKKVRKLFSLSIKETKDMLDSFDHFGYVYLPCSSEGFCEEKIKEIQQTLTNKTCEICINEIF